MSNRDLKSVLNVIAAGNKPGATKAEQAEATAAVRDALGRHSSAVDFQRALEGRAPVAGFPVMVADPHTGGEWLVVLPDESFSSKVMFDPLREMLEEGIVREIIINSGSLASNAISSFNLGFAGTGPLSAKVRAIRLHVSCREESDPVDFMNIGITYNSIADNGEAGYTEASGALTVSDNTRGGAGVNQVSFQLDAGRQLTGYYHFAQRPAALAKTIPDVAMLTKPTAASGTVGPTHNINIAGTNGPGGDGVTLTAAVLAVGAPHWPSYFECALRNAYTRVG